MPDEGGSQQQTFGVVEPIEIQEEMERSFLEYAMSVITARALPDARDGLKPVHRRILYGMYEQALRPDRPRKKCASAVGDVMAKYHPHGDTAIYDALARMAQDFSLRYPLVDGKGNFGSPDPNDRPAAMRYTECRLSALAMHLLGEIDEETVDFVPNYDGSNEEPLVLPARYPEPPGQRGRRDRGRHGDEHPAAQPPRGDRRHRPPHRPPRRHARRPDAVRARARLPDRRHHPRARRDHRGLPHRPRFDPHARRRRHRGHAHRPPAHRRDPDPVPDLGRGDRFEDRRAGRGAPDRGRERRQEHQLGGDGPPRDRAEARRQRPGRAEPALQEHPDAVELRRQHAGAGRRRAPPAQPGPGAERLRRPPGRGGHPALAVPPAQAARAHPHPRGPAAGARHDRRRHRPHPGLGRRRHRPPGPDGRAVLVQRGPGELHPRHGPAAPDRARGPEAARGARSARRRDRRTRGDPGRPGPPADGDQGRAARGPRRVRRRAAHADSSTTRARSTSSTSSTTRTSSSCCRRAATSSR